MPLVSAPRCPEKPLSKLPGLFSVAWALPSPAVSMYCAHRWTQQSDSPVYHTTVYEIGTHGMRRYAKVRVKSWESGTRVHLALFSLPAWAIATS